MLHYRRYSGNSSEKDQMLNLEIESGEGRGSKIHFESLFENNPVAKSIIVIASNNEGKILSKNHTVPTLIGYQGNTFLAYLSCGILVHRSVRRRGVFKKMLEIMNKEILKDGGKIRCGFPNRNSAKALKKYSGYKRHDEIIPCVKLKRDSSSLLKAIISIFVTFLNSFVNFNIDKRYKLKREAIYGEDLIKCLNKNLKQKKEAYFYKDIDYLNWRYGQNKEFKYDLYTLQLNNKPCGYLVIRNDKNKIKIIDFQICREEKAAFDAMLYLVENQYPNAKSFYIWSGINRWYHWRLKYRLFIPSSKKKAIEFNLVSFDGRQWPLNSWDIHMGDSDIS
jgi:hypothetical protein